jgi:hypothetical protein
MIITSNLTTLNMDGENSSVDGEQIDRVNPSESSAQRGEDTRIGNDAGPSVKEEDAARAQNDQKYL